MLPLNGKIYTNKINAPADIADAILIQRIQRVLREIIHSGRWDTDQGRKAAERKHVAAECRDKINTPAGIAKSADETISANSANSAGDHSANTIIMLLLFLNLPVYQFPHPYIE